MDPISAIGFAAGILNFIDSSATLVRGTYELYQSGTTDNNAHIGSITKDLQVVSIELSAKKELDCDDPHQRALSDLAEKCLRLSDDLVAVLDKLQVKGKNRKWKSVKVAWTSVVKQNIINSIEKRLGEYRSEIILRLNLMTSVQNSSLQAYLREMDQRNLELGKIVTGQNVLLYGKLMDAIQRLQVKGSSSSSQELHTAVRDWNRAAAEAAIENQILGHLYFDAMFIREESINDPETGTFEGLLDKHPSLSHQPFDLSFRTANSTRSGAELQKHQPFRDGYREARAQSDADVPAHGNILGHGKVPISSNPSSDFLHNNDSHSEITGSLHFAGGLSDDAAQLSARARASETFQLFLADSNGLFFISGKAVCWSFAGSRQQRKLIVRLGSEKSTLMKYLGYDSVLEHELKQWAGDQALLFARFFFWISGDQLQMSFVGFYRSLLFEILRQFPALIRVVFREIWEASADNRPLITNVYTLHSLDFLKSAMQQLIDTHLPSQSLCLMLDGLDEYEGDNLEHFELARMLKEWSQRANVKVICSARPHSEFIDTFDQVDRAIHLHELTRGDIRYFARAQFATRMPVSPSANLSNIFEEVSERIVEMADGSWLEELSDPYNRPCDGLVGSKIERRQISVHRQLDSLTRGLLEIKTTTNHRGDYFKQHRYWKFHMGFLHRSVRDFLRDYWQNDHAAVSLGDHLRLHVAEAQFAAGDHLLRYSTIYNMVRLIFDDVTDLMLEHSDTLQCTSVVLDQLDNYLRSVQGVVAKFFLGTQATSSAVHNLLCLQISWKMDQSAEPITPRRQSPTTASISGDGSLIRNLFIQGMSPNESCQISLLSNPAATDVQDYLASGEAPAWILFLRYYMMDSLQTTSSNRETSLHVLLKEYLKSGADTDLVILAVIAGTTWGHDLKETDSYKEFSSSFPGTKNIFYLELSQVLKITGDLADQEMMDLLQPKRAMSIRQQTSGVLGRINFRAQRGSSLRDAYRAGTVAELENSNLCVASFRGMRNLWATSPSRIMELMSFICAANTEDVVRQPHDYVVIPRHMFDVENENDEKPEDEQLDEDELEDKFEELVGVDKAGKPESEFPGYKWIGMNETQRLSNEYRIHATYTNPDMFGMYIYNDFYGYGVLECIQNALMGRRQLLAIDNEFKKKSSDRSVEQMWALSAALIHWIVAENGPWIGADDGEQVNATASNWLTLPNLLNLTLGSAASSVETFQNDLQGRFSQGFLGLHAAGHFSIGGDAGDLFSSPVDPAFWLHHSMLDRVWWLWQALHLDIADTIAGTITIFNKPPSRNTSLADAIFMGQSNAPARPISDLLNTLGDSPFCYIYL
ncbi:hypothetical protein SCUP515_12328 [Seiridium cupressi]